MPKRALEHQEQAYLLERARRLGRGVLLSSATVLSFLAGSLLLTDHLFQPQRFEIKQLKISGKFRYTTPQKIEATVVKDELANFFAADLDAIKAKVLDVPWVARAEVRRQWPDTLLIRVKEHRPLMRWHDLGSVRQKPASKSTQLWLSSLGAVIEVPDKLELPAINLFGNRDHAQKLMNTALRWQRELALSDLELLELKQSEAQSYSVTLRLGKHGEPFELLLGTKDMQARIARFQYLFDKQFRFSDFQLKRVDARYPNGLAVQQSRRAEPLEATEPVQG